jgi:hypothetical protein
VRGSLARENADLILGNRAVSIQWDAYRVLHGTQHLAQRHERLLNREGLLQAGIFLQAYLPQPH